MTIVPVTPPPARRAQAVVNALLIALGLLGLALAADSIVNTLAAAAPAERYTLSGPSIAIYDLAGQARLTAGTGTTLVVNVTRQGNDAEELKVVSGEVRGKQTLRVLFPSDRIIYSPGPFNFNTEVRVQDDGTFGEKHDDWSGRGRKVRISSRGSGLEAYADLDIQVPKGQELVVRLAAGDVSVKNVNGQLMLDTGSGAVTTAGTTGELKVDTGSGDVSITDARGDLDIDTGSGGISASGLKGDRIKMDTGSGDIRAKGIESSDLDLDTGSGDVEASSVSAKILRVDTGSGSVDIGLAAAAEKIDVDTGSGDVTLRVPSNSGADISFETGSGGFHSELPVELREIDQGSYRGRLGNGSARVVVETGSGNLHLAAFRTK
jgi:DUF4097 and DUF4098 domain-containing protein YvlB